MERRLLIVFALTFLVIMLFQPLLKKYGPQPAPTQPANQQGAQATPAANQPQAQNVNPAAGAVRSSPQGTSGKNAPPIPSTRQAESESETVIENSLYRIVFTNRGGRVKSLVLKKWDDEKGKPLELVNLAAAEKYGYPLSLWSYDENLRNKLNSALYVLASDQPVAGDKIGAKLSPPSQITFEYSDSDLSVQKTFKFDESYAVGVQTGVQVKGSEITALPMWPSGFGGELTAPSYAAGQIAYQYDSKVERLAIKKAVSTIAQI